MSDTEHTPSFEASMARLETLVSEMESGSLSIEASLQAFEEGIRLTRQCQQILEQAEQKVKLLTEEKGEILATPFNDPEADA
ncbi:MAG: exodeoxyribonuclease VII small subunit [Nitrincola lacisaponensis]|uniref:Exodeoxyribonuclease 7 small subunit n=1 Tax=Nitrincola lacisaponensis TaxID=267850 RepID=A0A063Y073_9GAMM|nr:exodeoxyribonuclease VII small subunit [Nitrincola lacisaponensis]KDE39738.1 Exodeoxyribonuclease VII small subunit [Nitrincola lacisaponensis]